ncbi:polyprenyl synthetase family protein [Aerococcus agrisoli]|uniref:Farnesyl diphosphate synthase n=1 Tax=Aerococcus agrisoli TaxID=2487350 RepID=A0A3N4H4W3_9LACT|nr:farnesyl diphosphate synthase [Aerococcus agrisoli]RPA60144.1 polyprenyl synthetase family protein [Aerococcus agrisoli]
METSQFIEETLPILQEKIDDVLAQNKAQTPSILQESMAYSLNTGGKRIRPMLLLATLKALGQNITQGFMTAIALEYIHTYSLIHDDLPAMDNDDYRRGKLTNHKAFDEATAILAGDALLTDSFALIGKDSLITNAEVKLDLINKLADAAGSKGMIAGQIGDVQAEGKEIDLLEMKEIHKNKTGELLHYAIYAGYQIANPSAEIKALLDEFAWTYGIAYQVQNDLQEVMWSDDDRGKFQHSDAALTKNTYPSILGTNGAIEALFANTTKCRTLLQQIKDIDESFDDQLLAGFLTFLKI